ncbi:hypothetical protein V500_07366 [Pseudogymnoascus sp. VKM F-4518 (FW-2643)]|nr:hypothetical protein V500_07366 [Pseudogymnoascus sp. VKM F-4518 (FW-2643)]
MQLTLLPSELQAHIVSGLNNRDKKSLRLTCSTLRDRSPLRIDRVFLSANVHNVEVFRAIADHEIFRKGVTEVIWDDALLAESKEQYEDEFYCEGEGLPDCDETCPVWFLWACRENLSWLTSRKGNDVDDLPQHLERAKQMEAQLPLNVSYAYYQGLLMQQESVLSTQADIEALKYGITRFPALKRITITPAAHGALYTPLYETPMIRAFPYGFNYLIPRAWPTVEPGFSPYEAPPWDTEAEKNKWRGFRIVLRTLAEQEHHISEFILDVNGLCTGLNCHVFDEPCEEYEDLVALLRKPGFNRIDLGLLVSTQQDEEWPSFRSGHLKHALGEAKDLQHVSLCTDLGANQEIGVPEEDSDVIPLRTIFPINRWQQLQHLGISGFVVRQDDLISLLAALPASLLSVELSFLHFYGDGNYRNLLCDMRDKLGWRDRSASKRPKVIIGGGGGGLVAVHVGRATWVEDEVSEFLYGNGLNPFGHEGDRFSPNQIRLGFGLERDEFEPGFERPWAQYDELQRLGYYPDVRLQYEEWKKSLSSDLST